MRKMAKALQAISDKTRLRILALLLEWECCICEIAQALEISPKKASHDLNILCDAGLLKLRKEGARSLYSVDRGGMEKQLACLVQSMEKALESYPVLHLDRDKLKMPGRVGPECVSQAR